MRGFDAKALEIHQCQPTRNGLFVIFFWTLETE